MLLGGGEVRLVTRRKGGNAHGATSLGVRPGAVISDFARYLVEARPVLISPSKKVQAKTIPHVVLGRWDTAVPKGADLALS